MSRVLGIVAEYNPFHNGHAYHIRESKRRTGAKRSGMCAIWQFCTKRQYLYC